ncbi:MAG: hypothetical protein HQM11_03805 [SAR324 cluster bacterium]|nr:hypothetical protein [SAR324 cluster bacterium]
MGIVVLIVISILAIGYNNKLTKENSLPPTDPNQQDLTQSTLHPAVQGVPQTPDIPVQMAPQTQSTIPTQVPLKAAPTRFRDPLIVTFSGTITAAHEIVDQGGMTHMFIQNDMGLEQEISVAPAWYLVFIGCPLATGTYVDGKGFVFDRMDGDASIYAKKIRLATGVCRFRNDEGFALWSDRLR